MGTMVPSVREGAATTVARFRAAMALIDRAHERGIALSQEAATALADAALAAYFAHLSAPRPNCQSWGPR